MTNISATDILYVSEADIFLFEGLDIMKKKFAFTAAILSFVTLQLTGRYFEIHDFFRGALTGLSLVFLLAATGLPIKEMKKKLFGGKRG